MKQIKLAFSDMWLHFNPNDMELVNILKERYNIVYDQIDPDCVICGPFGYKVITKYKCIRIFYTGEGITPDFNLYDYAIGFDRLNNDDRYLRLPLYYLYNHQLSFEKAIKKHVLPDKFFTGKTKFCNFIVSNGRQYSERDNFFKELDARKHVDSAGKYMNNMPNHERCGDILKFRESYKFTISFENSIMDGYITEKIVEAWASGTIPIYKGGNGIEKDFNTEAYIDVTKFKDHQDCIDYILYLDSHPDEYLHIAKQPIFTEDQAMYLDYKEELFSFFDHIFYNLDTFKRSSVLTMYGKEYQYRIAHPNKYNIIQQLRKVKHTLNI